MASMVAHERFTAKGALRDLIAEKQVTEHAARRCHPLDRAGHSHL
jgi:hypothetical protein